MKRSIIWYGYFTWMAGYFGGLLEHKHHAWSFVVAIGAYGVLVLTSKGE